MDLDSLSPAQLIAAHLALIVAVLHLVLGMVNWIRWLSVGHLVPPDVRWPLFVFSGAAIIFAMPFATWKQLQRPIYAGGIVMMAVYVLGYFAWHAAGHRPMLFLGPEAATHEIDVAFVVEHLFAGTVEFLAIVSEVALAVVLAYLLVVETSRPTGSE